ncbi:MAG: methyltransferase domain-containing protein [Planctomycetota bacterium]|nr:methyltransferase domain-containing protein [Planctomycetota bacterium]
MTRAPDPILDRYAESRRTEEGAESYSTKYDRELHKRISSYFERRAVERALARTGVREGLVLDLPCGAGRLTPVLEPVARRIVSADYSGTMVRVLKRRHGERHPDALVADSFRLPFRDRTFDLVYSARLSHHIGDEALRVAYLREVLRVSRAWTIVTIFDSRSLKNLLRDVRRVFSKKRPKNTLSREQVAEIAAGDGFSIIDAIPLSRIASGHVFYVLQRA